MLVSRGRAPRADRGAGLVDKACLPLIARSLALGLALFLLARPFLAVLHAAALLGLAGLLRALSAAPFWPGLIALLPVDPVYTLAVIGFAGEVEPRGLALGGPLGGLLAAWWPALFADPSLAAPGAWASAVLAPGATVLASGLAGFGADLALLSLGLGLWRVGCSGRLWLAVCGGLQVAHVALFHLLDARLSLQDLEAAGLPFAISTLVSPAESRAPWFTARLAELPAPLVSIGAGAILVAVALVLARLLVRVAEALVLRLRRTQPLSAPAQRTSSLLLAGSLLLAVSPAGSFAAAETTVLPESGASAAGLTPASPGRPGSASARVPVAAVPRRPVPVRFEGSQYRYRYLVDGAPSVVRGMGYNVEYAALPVQERVRRYDRDFATMRAAGVNTIFGWFEWEFDEVTIDAAERHGLGVGMPFELNQDLDYDDPRVRAELTERVLAYVARFKDHPAVHMWTPANEVVHRLIFPSWLRREHDPERAHRADSFARFYVELIDRVHAADPLHPVVYRDAEEVYLPRIRDNLLKDGRQRPWFAYGANVYTRRLDEILRTWPLQGLAAPLLVSEFAPGGTGPDERPRAFRSIWATIRAYPDWVIGGAAYAWATNGPEELDRVFGLVDTAGAPRDGSLAAISELYRADAGPTEPPSAAAR